VHRDCGNPARLVFVEEWNDHASLKQHFNVPASRTFIAELSSMALEPPTMTSHAAERVGP